MVIALTFVRAFAAFDFLVDLDGTFNALPVVMTARRKLNSFLLTLNAVEGKKSKPVKMEDDARSPSSEEAGAVTTGKSRKRKPKATDEDEDE